MKQLAGAHGMRQETPKGQMSFRAGSRGLLALLFAGIFLSPPPCGGEAYRNVADGILNMDYADGRLSLETRDAPLDKVLKELSRLAEVNIVSDGPLEGRVTVYVNRQPTDAAARKILRGKDLSFLYREKDPSEPEGEYRLREIRIYVPQGTPGQEQRFSYPSRDPNSRSEAIRARQENREAERAQTRARRIEDRTPRDMPGAEADQFLSGLLGGNLEALDGVAEKLRAENPEVGDQIDQFMQALEEAKARAADSGAGMPPMGNLGSMGAMMQRIMEGKGQQP
jgi:hypothetical protein